MNPGTFQGPGTGALGGSITRYSQTPLITTSQTIPVPNGVQRIEALLVGGGGSGASLGNSGSGGGGFGGAAVIEIPATGSPLQVVIGAGGASPYADGSPTYISSAGTIYGLVGGGGGGNGMDGGGNATFGGSGRAGGGGGGTDSTGFGGWGGAPPIGNILWTTSTQIGRYSISATASTGIWATAGCGQGQWGNRSRQTSGSFGGGAGGASNITAYDGGGAASGFVGILGSGGGYGQNGGSMSSISIWGYTGRAAGTQAGGGGGLFGVGGDGFAPNGQGGNGGLGGGGGTGYNIGGTGGNGAAVIRFYF